MIGSPPWYVWYEEWWQLTEAVRRKPYSVILFDEIEKAHGDVFNILLQVLDYGQLTDSKWKTVDFKNTIIILTSNIGSDIIMQKWQNNEQINQEFDILPLLQTYFRPEFLNRLDDTIIFNAINKDILHQIVDVQLNQLADRIQKEKNIIISFSQNSYEFFIHHWRDTNFWARPLQRKIQKYIVDQLANQILAWSITTWDSVVVDVVDNEIIINKK